jgi:hypothetical protein
MNRFRTVVGIDPSGRRLSVAAMRGGIGGLAPQAPPACHDLRGEREAARLEEAEGLLADYVARHRLGGSAARLCVPADRVYTARVSFPPLKDRDLRAALELELERLFPVPPSSLRFGWRRLAESGGKNRVALAVAAAPRAYLEAWEEIASRAGLVLRGAVPAAWAVSAAWSLAGAGRVPGLCAILRDAGGGVEGTVLAGGEPLFSARRPCAEEAMPAEGLALLEDGLVDAPAAGEEDPVPVAAPAGWLAAAGEGGRFRPVEEFEAAAARVMGGPGTVAEALPVWRLLGAFGAAANGRTIDLLAPEGGGAASPATRAAVGAVAALAVVLAVAWPSALVMRTSGELRRLDAEIASIRPAVAHVEEALAELAAVEERIAVLGEAAGGRAQALSILRELTDRLPDGTWLTGLRVEERKVEIDGLSPSASEIFPLLTQDGRFRGVEFASPVIRQADNLERFRIRAEFVAPGKAPAGAAR